MRPQSPDQPAAKTLLMRAALRRRNRIAIGVEKRVEIRRPGDSPFHGAFAVAVFGASRETARRDHFMPFDLRIEEIEKSARKFQCFFGRDIAVRLQKFRRTAPAYFHAAVQIRLRARHAVKRFRQKMHRLAEYLGVWFERHHRSSAVGGAGILQLAGGLSALEAHFPAMAFAKYVDFHPF